MSRSHWTRLVNAAPLLTGNARSIDLQAAFSEWRVIRSESGSWNFFRALFVLFVEPKVDTGNAV
jgi:hypothetical protein